MKSIILTNAVTKKSVGVVTDNVTSFTEAHDAKATRIYFVEGNVLESIDVEESPEVISRKMNQES